MDYYAAPSVPATAFVQPPTVSGEPPKFWTHFTDASELVERKRSKNSGETPDAVNALRTTSISTTPTFGTGREVSGNRAAAIAETQVERMARQRAQIIAMRNENRDVTSDLLARLQILNRRLAEQVPRVQERQVAALEVAAASLETLREAHAQRMARLSALRAR